MEKVYCATCLEYLETDLEKEFQCDNPACISRYKFRVFNELHSAEIFFNSIESWRTKFIFKRIDKWIVTYNNDVIEPYLVTKLTDIVNDQTVELYAKGMMAHLNNCVLIVQEDGTIFNLKNSEKNEKKCTEYCAYIHDITDGEITGLEHCKSYYKKYISEITKDYRGKQVWDMCWAGVINICVPIKIEDILLGTLIIGQKSISEHSKHFPRVNHKIQAMVEVLNEEKSRISRMYSNAKEKIDNPEELIEKLEHKVKELNRQFEEHILESYINKKLKRDELFFEEICYYLERYFIEGTKGVERMAKILKRLNEYFYLEESYCLFSFNTNTEPFKVVAKGSSNELNEREKDFNINLTDKKNVTNSIMLDEMLPGEHDQYLKMIDELEPKRKNREVWVAFCPLMGASTVIFIFINPVFKKGLPETKKLTYLERDFLRKFVIRVREKINNGISFNILLERIGHELGSSVQVLLANSINILTEKDKPHIVEEYAKKNINELEQYGFSIENIKSVFVETDRKHYRFKKYSLQNLLGEIKAILEDDVLSKYYVPIKDFRFKGNSIIEMDYKYLKRAFYNLVSNALKYSFKNHYVTISGHEDYEEKYYIIKITNYGVGILKEEIAYRLIFKEMYRGKLSLDRNRTGNGLGLAISEEIIKNHQGLIDVESLNQVDLRNQKFEFIDTKMLEKTQLEIQELIKIGHLNIFQIKLPFYQKDKL